MTKDGPGKRDLHDYDVADLVQVVNEEIAEDEGGELKEAIQDQQWARAAKRLRQKHRDFIPNGE